MNLRSTIFASSTIKSMTFSMAERLFQIRPFVPDTDLPTDWRNLLVAWIGGTDVTQIGLDNTRVIDEAFIYRLVWAIEAIRMKRRAEGGQSEYIEGKLRCVRVK